MKNYLSKGGKLQVISKMYLITRKMENMLLVLPISQDMKEI